MLMNHSKNNMRLQTVFCAGLAAMIIAGCGKKSNDDSPAPAQNNTQVQPVNAQPTPMPTPTPASTVTPGTGAPVNASDGLAVEIRNRAAIEGQSLSSNSLSVEFGLKASQQQVAGISYRCKLATNQNKDTLPAETCSSPKVIQVQQPGQYYFTVFAVHDASNTIGASTELSFVVGANGSITGGMSGAGEQGQGQGGVIGGGGGVVIGGGNIGGMPGSAAQQVGDMFAVNIPQGFHMIYRSSTFDIPGSLRYQYIDGGRQVDTAAPYAYSCAASSSSGLQNPFTYQSPIQLLNGSGQAMPYCDITPPLNWNAPADPLANPFRYMTMNMLSYNGIALASDSTLSPSGPAPGIMQPSMAKLYANVFTNVSGTASSPFLAPFATELNATVSRMAVACAGEPPQYLGNAAIFQGYFSFQLASTPLFGCTVRRNLQWYVEIAAFPIDSNMSIAPSQGWGGWIGQSFANKRAAEIVVELGPYPVMPNPVGVAPAAQDLMVQNIKKLLPSATPTGNGIPAPGIPSQGYGQGGYSGNSGGYPGNPGSPGGYHGHPNTNGPWIPNRNH